MSHVYTENDILTIKNEGFNHSLPEMCLNVISRISEEVGAPTYIRTPVFPKPQKRKKNNTTIFNNSLKAKEGLDLYFTHVRSNLNKITSENYQDVSSTISENIQLLIDNDAPNESLIKIANMVFNIATTNKFYSTVYADLYFDLIQRFPLFDTMFQESFKNYLELYDNIGSLSENDDYDAFCEQNRKNTERRAFTTFIVNITKKNIIDNSELFDLCWKLQTNFDNSILQENKKPLCDELCENIFIIMTEGYICLKNEQRYASLNGKAQIIKNTKVKDMKSLTSRSLFKYYDILDYIEKQ